MGERRTLRLVARHAGGWHAAFPESPDDLGLGVEPEDRDRFLREDADRCVEFGFTQFTLGFNGPDWAVGEGEAWLRWRDERNRGR